MIHLYKMQAAMKSTITMLILLLAGVFFADPATAQRHKRSFGGSDRAGFTMKGTIYFLREGTEKLVIDNDGLHEAQAKEVSIPLLEGTHNVQVKYFQGPAYEVALQLEIARGDGEHRVLNTDRWGRRR